jgi:hypothetical protein
VQDAVNQLAAADHRPRSPASPRVRRRRGAMLETCGWVDASVVSALSSGEDVPSR